MPPYFSSYHSSYSICLLILKSQIKSHTKFMVILFILLLNLVIKSHGIQHKLLHDKLGELGTIDDDPSKDEYEKGAFEMSLCQKHCENIVNVDNFGAVGDGLSDDTQAFSRAWKQACSTPKSVFFVPKRRTYLVNATIFAGPCADRLTVKIDGTIVAPADPNHWDHVKFGRIWLVFSNLTGVLFKGKGVIDGSGSQWWASSCKRNRTNPCIPAPTALTLEASSDIRFRDLTVINSQQFHFTIYNCKSVRVTNAVVTAPRDSPNTDGIHISRSTDVVLKKCFIATGDDCISIISGSSNIYMKSIYCGPGHGISIGSLGKNNATDFVQNIVLNGAFIKNTTNGLRIKSWQGGSGYAKAIKFQNVIMEDVQNPIIIDQFYCDSFTPCANQTKGVEISEITYRNIFGTTASDVAMKFACSDSVPCSNIMLANIMLVMKNGETRSFCNSASGIVQGIVDPPADCLTCNNNNNNITCDLIAKSTSLDSKNYWRN
ncbi:hypothetical protein RND81_13G136300 [Saponaria officinalis]|uniref:endo-polygalacturonase n=1 Tax=Saponaria officinalis TaxID=3572 RepID=A0AAW1H149_SAPOF